jgi:hypothetical protein
MHLRHTICDLRVEGDGFAFRRAGAGRTFEALRRLVDIAPHAAAVRERFGLDGVSPYRGRKNIRLFSLRYVYSRLFGFLFLSFRPGNEGLAAGKSPEPAGWKARATTETKGRRFSEPSLPSNPVNASVCSHLVGAGFAFARASADEWGGKGVGNFPAKVGNGGNGFSILLGKWRVGGNFPPFPGGKALDD